MKLRKLYPVNYFEPKAPSFDDYVYCDFCADFVYEYCSIHGSLLVIPDDKVYPKTNYPSYVPRAAITIPKAFLHIAPSYIPGAGLGVFTSLTLPRGVRFGPYQGRNTTDVESTYCWQLHDEDRRKKGVVDASDANTSNWMRYVNCARHWCEQNLVAYQYQGQIYYRTIKIIPRFTELLVFYGGEFARCLDINLKQYDNEDFYIKIRENTIKNAIIQERNNDLKLREDVEVLPNYEEIAVSNKSPTDSNSRVNSVNKVDTEVDTTQNFVIIDENLFNEDPTLDADNESNSPTVEFDRENNNFHIQFDHNKNSGIAKNINSIETDFKCDACNRNFTTNYNLNRHKVTHQNTDCHLCPFITKSSSNLRRHIRRMHNEDKENKQEKVTDDKSSNYICAECFKSFNTQKNLRRHQKNIHCLNSNEIFVSKTNISNNNKNIERDNVKKNKYDSYICDICAKSTVRKDGIRRHMQIVHGFDKSKRVLLKCNKCAFTTYLKQSLKRHGRLVHKIL